jgi:hypothetical protein
MKASSVYVVLGILSVSYCSAIPKPGEDEHKNRVHDKVCLYLLSLCSKPGEYDVRLFVVNTDYWVILVFVCFPYQVLILLEKKFNMLPERCT